NMLYLTTLSLLFVVGVTANQLELSVIENGKRCTQWVPLSSLSISMMPGLCSGAPYAERNAADSGSIRACCDADVVPTKPIPNQECGKQIITPTQTRIVGGSEARAHSWPWLISFQRNGGHSCGGTLIDTQHVLTAAHCIDTEEVNSGIYSVVTGLHDHDNWNYDRRSPQRHRIAKIFIHNQYDTNTQENDIAILRLDTPVTLSEHVNIACLQGPDPEVNSNVMIAGWGTTSFQGSVSQKLLQAPIKIMNGCHVYNFNNEKQLCGGTPQFHMDTCQGDSGGPLMYQANGQWHVSGVVSYGNGCAFKDFPGVYTRVSHYIPWINQIRSTA
ncbi:unnamed protein product, partial [Didymodactylos carnosus]